MTTRLEQPLSAEAQEALTPLWKAYRCAQELGLSPWEFSLRLLHLLDLGISESTLRLLASRGHIEFAEDITTFRDPTRRFRRPPRPPGEGWGEGLPFGPATCFVLSAKGASAMHRDGEMPRLAPPAFPKFFRNFVASHRVASMGL